MNGDTIVDGVGRGDDRLDGKRPKLVPRNKLLDDLIDRLAEQKFQDMCHDTKDADVQRFCDGCEKFQIEKFGRSPITDLRARLRAISAIASDPASTVASMSHIRDLADLTRPTPPVTPSAL